MDGSLTYFSSAFLIAYARRVHYFPLQLVFRVKPVTRLRMGAKLATRDSVLVSAAVAVAVDAYFPTPLFWVAS